MRYVKGWGPDELANRAEISRTALYQIENGKTGLPRAATLRRIAVALEVPMENLLLGLEHEAEPATSESQRPRLGQPRDICQWKLAEGAPLPLPNQTGGKEALRANVDESRTALNAELPIKKSSNDWIFVREGELMSKLHDLLHSPVGRGVAEIVEELHGALCRSRPSV
jgi:transcriptional regulator with XRE-family HTH domain